MNWIVFLVVSWFAFGLEAGFDALRLAPGDVAPSFVIPIIVYIALSAPAKHALWAASFMLRSESPHHMRPSERQGLMRHRSGRTAMARCSPNGQTVPPPGCTPSGYEAAPAEPPPKRQTLLSPECAEERTRATRTS